MASPHNPRTPKLNPSSVTRFASADHVRPPPDALNHQLSFSVPDFEPEVIALVVIPRSPREAELRVRQILKEGLDSVICLYFAAEYLPRKTRGFV